MRPNLTTLCPGCAVRLPAGTKSCPRCERRDLLDLEREASRRKVPMVLTKHVPSPLVRGLRALEGGVMRAAQIPWLAVPVVFVVLAVMRGSPRVAALVAGLVALAIVFLSGATVLVFSAGRLLSSAIASLTRWMTRSTQVRRRAWPLPAPTVTGETPRVRVRGRVESESTMPSPLGHDACVAYRLVGTTAGGEIDDAMLLSFDVRTEDGELVHVPQGDATVALEPDEDPVVVTPDAPLALFLDERAALLRLGPARLAEAVLRVGDEVSVEGVAVTRPVQLGYRTTAERRRIVEQPGAPRVVRKLG